MTTPTFEERLDAILPTLATKADIAAVTTELTRLECKMDAMTERLEGKMDAMTERLEGKMDAMPEGLEGKLDAMGNRLLVRCSIAMIVLAAIAVAAVKYL